MAIVTLIEARPRRVSDGVEVDARLGGGGSPGRPLTGYRGHADWRAGIAAPIRLSTAIGFDASGWTGGATPQTGSIRFAPSDRAFVTYLADALNWQGATVTIYTGDDTGAAEPSWEVALAGVCAGVSAQDGGITITIADLALALDKTILSGRFTGAGGIEGVAEAAERIKRRSWGRCFNVEGRLLDKVNNVYEFGDPAHALQQFVEVRDKGRVGPIDVLGWQGSVAATFAALRAATAAQGGGVAAPSIACVKWWTVPAGPLTADILGENSVAYVDTVARIAERVVAAVSSIPIVNATEAVTLRPDEAGVHVDQDTETAASILDRLLLPVSLVWILTPGGTIELRQFTFENPLNIIAAPDRIERVETFKPMLSRRVGYRKNHREQTDAEISVAVLASDVLFDEGDATVQQLRPADPGATKGAPMGTNVGGVRNPVTGAYAGGKTSQAVITQIDLSTSTGATHTAQLAALFEDVDDLVTIYGTTSSAAFYASQSAAERAAAQTARTAAEAAQALALAQANLASSSATSASGSATAAAGSAATASSSSTSAGTSATVATAAAGTATSQAGTALFYSNQSATSATNASGSASSAFTSAGLAATAQGQAATSASVATTAAATATSSASSASTSASVAATAAYDVTTGITAITATVTTQSAAIATIAGRTQAYWNVGVAAAGATAFIQAFAETSPGTTTSDVAIGAKTIRLLNPSATGGFSTALYVTGGNAYFSGRLEANSVTASMIDTGSLVADLALVNTAYIKNANIENLTIGTDKLAYNALSQSVFADTTGVATMDTGGWTALKQTPGGPGDTIFASVNASPDGTSLITLNIQGQTSVSTDSTARFRIKVYEPSGSSRIINFETTFRFMSGSLAQSWTFLDTSIRETGFHSYSVEGFAVAAPIIEHLTLTVSQFKR